MQTEPITPYSSSTPYVSAGPSWATQEDSERLAAYALYESLYWSIQDTFELVREQDHGAPIYLPKPMVIADTTAHFLMKGLQINVEDAEKNSEFKIFLDDFLDREEFYSRWNVAKHAGVVRGDWIFHVTADPTKEDGRRISLNSVDPGSYFPVYDPDDPEAVIGVRLLEQYTLPGEDRIRLKILEYGYNDNGTVWSTENVWEVEGWNNPERATLVSVIIPLQILPPEITQIPVYHFKNRPYDGYPFGNSELKGFERLFEGVDQLISDTDTALALVGLGVYVTDASRPIDDRGNEVDWVVSPGKVLEVPGATMFKKVEGIASIDPTIKFLDHLDKHVNQSSATSDVALGIIDATVAESPIALAIRFLPTSAKLEQRDLSCLSLLKQMFFDLQRWFASYEGKSSWLDIKIIPTIGEKLPLNRAKAIEELNNMLDRKVISKQYYRTKMSELGYNFPEDIAQQILDEIIEEREALTPPELKNANGSIIQPGDGKGGGNPDAFTGPGGRKQGAGDTVPQPSRSNNAASGNVNESRGTEVDTKK